MLRATYDIHGNIILGSIMRDVPVPTSKEPVMEHETCASATTTWTVLQETRREVREIRNPEPLALKESKPSVIHNVGTHAKKILRESMQEGGTQILRTAKDAEHGMQKAKRSLSSIPRKAAEGMTSFWRIAQTPVALPARKPGRRPPRKITLFVVDTVRFGGTFGLIFAVLFVGINYQSFWQIAQAELALGSDIGTEQALQDITGGGSAALKAFRASQPSGDANILKYLPVVGPYENRLIIPKLGENVPIVRPSMDALMKEDWITFESDIQVALKDGVVHYPGSARPGQPGNFFLTGHSSYYPWDDGKYKNVFARLGELDLGDTYTVYYGGDRHTYRIVKKYEVKPSDVSVLDQPTSKRLATLMTCTPIGTTLRRLIVLAEEIDITTGDVLNVGEKTESAGNNPFTRLDALPI
ncbi:MAG: sortase [Candidatus Peribacteraceae bacterium]|nr:sortase [Candidatus Peribacteraceae bacterium]MBP9850399.1 sortase [Candidatus Peribacteraceae bacterium]